MNCENIKKGDIVKIHYESIFSVGITEYRVKKVNKKTFVVNNGDKYWKIDGTYVYYSPFSKREVIEIKQQ